MCKRIVMLRLLLNYSKDDQPSSTVDVTKEQAQQVITPITAG